MADSAGRGPYSRRRLFAHLAARRFPAGAFIRPEKEIDYLSEPDVFHDVYGHVPLLADPAYARFLESYGKGGLRALRMGRLHNLARLYWYTVEFGLLRTESGLRIYGAGILSSRAESLFALDDDSPHRVSFDLLRVMRTRYRIDDFQQTYFVVDSFAELLARTVGTDFAPLYRELAGLSDLDPGSLLPADGLLSRGSQHYAAAKRAAG
jgi:phenylalanine-4-hydroxylase